MKYIQGQDRSQLSLFPISLDAGIEADNEVRLIDLFVESLDMEALGFQMNHQENGRPAYHPKDLLKLFIYGYLNRTRSSRELEKETKRNMEVIWLLRGLNPDHHTINRFRKNNPKAIRKVFRSTVQIAKNFELIGGKLIAGDGSKFRAQNSRKNNYNQKKIDRHIKYIDNKLEEYTTQLAEADGDLQKNQIQEKIQEKNDRKEGYKQLEKQLKTSGQKQISTSDPDSRQLLIRSVISEVAYNTQTTVDAKNCIPIDYKITNENDTGAMGNMVSRAKSILGHQRFSVLFDKGYHKGRELDKAQQLGITTYVAIPAIPRIRQAPDPNYNAAKFTYDSDTDTYLCPEKQTLTSTGKWYENKNFKFKQYKTKACINCPVKQHCTTSKVGKVVQRSEYQPAIEANKANMEAQPDLYKLRQMIVEHPFGTMKRSWGFDYIITKKTILSASADMGFIFTAYNLRRILNLVPIKKLKAYFCKAIAVCVPFFAVKQLNRALKCFFGHWVSNFQKLSFLLLFDYQTLKIETN
jgi:transposase